MMHMSTIRSEIDNSSLVPVLQNGPKPQLSILKIDHSDFDTNDHTYPLMRFLSQFGCLLINLDILHIK